MANEKSPTKSIDRAKLKVRMGLQDGLLVVTLAEVSAVLSTSTLASEAGDKVRVERRQVDVPLELPEAMKAQLARLVEGALLKAGG